MRSVQVAGALCGSLLMLASCGREAVPEEMASPAAADVACVDRGCYAVEELGPVHADMPWMTSLAVNARGLVVGTTDRWSSDPDSRRAFTFSGGAVSPLDARGYPGEARAINDWGLAVGGSVFGEHWRAASYLNGAVTELGSLDGTHSWAQDVNNAGFVVGGGYVSGVPHAAAFFRGKAFDLGSLGGETYGNGVNDLFEVVGAGVRADGFFTGFLRRGGRLVPLTELGVPAPSDARAINNRGTICGWRNPSDPSEPYYNQAFLLFRDGSRVDLQGLGAPYTWCLDVNDAGLAVGFVDDGVTGWRAVAWPDPAQPPVDLNSRVVPALPDVQLIVSSGLSSTGLITAYGWLPSTDEIRGYLLRPTPCPR